MKNIFILTENFYPAYKAGGPIQSLTNLITALERDYDFYVVTSAYDLNSENVMENIRTNEWNTISLPGAVRTTQVWYVEGGIKFSRFNELLKSIKPECIYLNGIFSLNYFLKPVITAKIYKGQLRIIICPRGMLQAGAISGKYLKKKFYLALLKFSGVLNKALWHATNQEEKEDILKLISSNSFTIEAKNIPKPPSVKINFIEKNPGMLRLVYLSLITEKKNLFFLLEAVRKVKNISLDIYGPVKDKDYWNKCKRLIDVMPGKVQYKGDTLPSQVQQTFSQYHSSVLLTKGENFGHALYESLSVGRPIITSKFTPWNNLTAEKAGWNVDINNETECIAALTDLREMPQQEYNLLCEGAHRLAISYYKSVDVHKSYRKLFDYFEKQ